MFECKRIKMLVQNKYCESCKLCLIYEDESRKNELGNIELTIYWDGNDRPDIKSRINYLIYTNYNILAVIDNFENKKTTIIIAEEKIWN